jgi:hypothetical protein
MAAAATLAAPFCILMTAGWCGPVQPVTPNRNKSGKKLKRRPT